MIERGDLADHPADADAREMCRPVVELAGQGRGVGGKVAQCVRGSLGIDDGRLARIAQVVSHDVAPAVREGLAQRVGPREHGGGTREQDERRPRVAEVLDPERDTVRFKRGHQAPPTKVPVRPSSSRR
jgi:hypothetical protein